MDAGAPSVGAPKRARLREDGTGGAGAGSAGGAFASSSSSSSSAAAAAALERQKREQVPRACQRCASSKRKCNGTFPCERCVRLGVADSCVEVIVRRKLGAGAGAGGGGGAPEPAAATGAAGTAPSPSSLSSSSSSSRRRQAPAASSVGYGFQPPPRGPGGVGMGGSPRAGAVSARTTASAAHASAAHAYPAMYAPGGLPGARAGLDGMLDEEEDDEEGGESQPQHAWGGPFFHPHHPHHHEEEGGGDEDDEEGEALDGIDEVEGGDGIEGSGAGAGGPQDFFRGGSSSSSSSSSSSTATRTEVGPLSGRRRQASSRLSRSELYSAGVAGASAGAAYFSMPALAAALPVGGPLVGGYGESGGSSPRASLGGALGARGAGSASLGAMMARARLGGEPAQTAAPSHASGGVGASHGAHGLPAAPPAFQPSSPAAAASSASIRLGGKRTSEEDLAMGANVDLLLRVSGERDAASAGHLHAQLEKSAHAGTGGGGVVKRNIVRAGGQAFAADADATTAAPRWSPAASAAAQGPPPLPALFHVVTDASGVPRMEIGDGEFVNLQPPAGVTVTPATDPATLSPYCAWRLTFRDPMEPSSSSSTVAGPDGRAAGWSFGAGASGSGSGSRGGGGSGVPIRLEANPEGLALFGVDAELLPLLPRLQPHALWVHPDDMHRRAAALQTVRARGGTYLEWPGRYVSAYASDAAGATGGAGAGAGGGGEGARASAAAITADTAPGHDVGGVSATRVIRQSTPAPTALVRHFAIFRSWERIFIDYYRPGVVHRVLSIFSDVRVAHEELSQEAVDVFMRTMAADTRDDDGRGAVQSMLLRGAGPGAGAGAGAGTGAGAGGAAMPAPGVGWPDVRTESSVSFTDAMVLGPRRTSSFTFGLDSALLASIPDFSGAARVGSLSSPSGAAAAAAAAYLYPARSSSVGSVDAGSAAGLAGLDSRASRGSNDSFGIGALALDGAGAAAAAAAAAAAGGMGAGPPPYARYARTSLDLNPADRLGSFDTAVVRGGVGDARGQGGEASAAPP
jgi:hypothetical protein